MTWQPVAFVRSSRTEPVDDDWDAVSSTIELADGYGADALLGIDGFSHLEVVYLFHLVDPDRPVLMARHPRGNPDWPMTGIFAQRAKDRPNRLGVSSCELVGVSGTTLEVRGLDAIDGTPVLDIKPYMTELAPRSPVLDIKPYMTEFAPRSPVRQPAWSHELMAGYFRPVIDEPRGL